MHHRRAQCTAGFIAHALAQRRVRLAALIARPATPVRTIVRDAAGTPVGAAAHRPIRIQRAAVGSERAQLTATGAACQRRAQQQGARPGHAAAGYCVLRTARAKYTVKTKIEAKNVQAGNQKPMKPFHANGPDLKNAIIPAGMKITAAQIAK